MMKKIKKILCLSMILVMALQVKMVPAEDTEISTGEEVAPRYTNITSVYSAVTRSGSVATCTARYNIVKNLTSSLTMILQKSKDDDTYSNVTFWSNVYEGTGSKSLSRTTTISKGYYYRVKAVITIYSGSSSIEKITAYSTAMNYK